MTSITDIKNQLSSLNLCYNDKKISNIVSDLATLEKFDTLYILIGYTRRNSDSYLSASNLLISHATLIATGWVPLWCPI